MAAWKQTSQWNDAMYKNYRNYVAAKAPGLKGRKEDCADLSIMLLIDFAALHGLPITFNDVDGWIYTSKALTGYGPDGRRFTFPWLTKEAFTIIVQKNMQTKGLWQQDTTENQSGPEPGDLMMRYTTFFGYTNKHHTALVFAVYPPGVSHPKRTDSSVPNYPGDDEAMEQKKVTEYFRGTVDGDGKTAYRYPDKDIHFDYLNSRGDDKRNAERIYYANARQLSDDGFEFRKYSPKVIDNWDDYNGEGRPPRGIGWPTMSSQFDELNDEGTGTGAGSRTS